MDRLQDLIKDVIEKVDPSNVNWDSGSSIASFFSYLFLALVVIIAIIVLIWKYRSVKSFFKGVYIELKRVEWLNRKDLKNFSVVTVLLIAFFGLFLLGVDKVFVEIRNLIILN